MRKVKANEQEEMIVKKIVKNNGSVTFLDCFDHKEESYPEEPHKCFDCCNVLCCDKVFDQEKKTIDNYSFITDGFQTITEKGKVDNFIVRECNNFKIAKKKLKTALEEARAEILKEQLRISYFEANSLEESYKMEHYMIKKGYFKDPEYIVKRAK